MKDLLRKELINKRKKISKTYVIKKSRLIENNLFSLEELKSLNTILFYASYDNEVFTHDMIKKCLNTGKNIILPISDVKNKVLLISKIKKFEDLKIGAYNILEPVLNNEEKIMFEDIDIIIVPGVGFDYFGNRLGHGLGYYDKLLKKFKNTINIGLAFEFQLINRIKNKKYDVPVDKIITEDRIINCKN